MVVNMKQETKEITNSFFDANDEMTEDCKILFETASLMLEALYHRYLSLGYSPREIHYVIEQSSACLSSLEIVRKKALAHIGDEASRTLTDIVSGLRSGTKPPPDTDKN